MAETIGGWTASAAEPVDGRDAERARSFNLFALPEGYFEAPHPWFKLLRDHDPIHANPDGSVLLTRNEDVKTVWRDLSGLVDKTAQFRAKFGEGPLFEHHTTAMLFRDPPDHDRLRTVVNPFFGQASIERLRAFVQETVQVLLEETAERREIDFVYDFAARLPIALICRILGVPGEDAGTIQALGRKVLFPLNPGVGESVVAEGHAAVAAFKVYLKEYVDAARARAELDPGADIISALVAAERRGYGISEDEILHMCILVLNGGHETTTNLIAVSLHALIDEPDQLALLRDDPAVIQTGVEELIRFVSPLQLQGRRTTRPIVVGSGEIPENVEVVICQASANRDERVFANPERIDLRRRPNAHLAFGAGVHVCIGRLLARLEASVALPAIVRRFRHIERTGEAIFNRNARFRGLSALPLRFY